ncbi:MAG: tetratricopeptide repeat protein, partial [Planctomycetota bacterium]
MATLVTGMKHLCAYGAKFFIVLALFGAYALPAYTQENSWKELNDKATSLFQKKRYADATKPGEEALALAKNTFSAGDTRIADSMNLLGILYRTYGRYADAEPLFHQALAIYKKSNGEGHPSVAKVLYELGETFSLQDKYTEAEPFYSQSLGIYEKAFGADH